ncbi:SMODS domain-containing nucleotidyltransferase, partial [Cellulosimicrobium funkei]
MLAESFETFVNSLQLKNSDDIDTKFKSITKRLNMSYYGSNSEEEHGYKVGSLGRKTAINGISDMDMLFVLPKTKFKQYDEYKGNGQSALLQDVKAEIRKRYPNESIIVRGDGQVVVVTFSNYEVEVCPAFENSDGSYKFPDSKYGGTWKRTDPMVEIGESEYTIDQTNGHFKNICQMVRAWKNNIGFKMGGL